MYKLRIAPCFALPQSYRYEHFRAACASLRAHTCCLRNRIQSLTHASRQAACLRFRRAFCITNCISPRVTSLLRSFRAANRYSLMFFPIGEQAPRGQGTLRLDLYSKRDFTQTEKQNKPFCPSVCIKSHHLNESRGIANHSAAWTDALVDGLF